MRLFLGFVLVVGGAFAALYYGGGFATFDPSQQGRDAKAQIAPGMAWKKVIDVAGEPREYCVMIVKKGFVVPGPSVPFQSDQLAQRVAENSLPEGFAFQYRFSESEAFDVTFDASGTVQHVQDAITMATLLDMPKDD